MARVAPGIYRTSSRGWLLTPAPPSSIVVLFSNRGPTTVAWLVVTIIVNAIKRFPRWALTHVPKKRFEVISPLVAHHDPAPSVIRILLIGLRVAPRLRAKPSNKLSGVRFPVLEKQGATTLKIPWNTSAMSFELPHAAAFLRAESPSCRHPQSHERGRVLEATGFTYAPDGFSAAPGNYGNEYAFLHV